ncbi:MAG: hypothetical protein E6K69_06285 [Nitrospirae bacterium]|nr:MAG: hypothetical protein E6K69_06285 [Nitrospirota bacterium]
MSVVTLCMGLTSCQKLEPDEVALKATRQLKIEMLKSLDAIPTEYGNLVGVTSSSYRPDIAQLWFEKPDKTIVVVSVNFVKGGLWSNYLLIPRR